MTRRPLEKLLPLIAILLVSCAGTEPDGSGRWAFLAIENLSPDPSVDWVGPAISDIIAEELTGAQSFDAEKASSRSDALGLRATRIVSGYFTLEEGLLKVRLVVEDPKSERIVARFGRQGTPDEVVSVADSLAGELSPERRAYGTSDAEAIRPYAKAIGLGRPADYDRLLEDALKIDPGFSQAHLALAQFHLSRGEREAVEEAVEAALSADEAPDEIDQARLELIRARAQPDRSALLAAMERLADLTPADSGLAEQIAGVALVAHDYAKAATWLGRAAETDPSNRQLWNQLGYAEAWRGDLDAARRSLLRYRDTAPDDPNALDSLGEVHYHLGSFSDAARYFLECNRMAPDFQNGNALWKAASATWRAGDLSRADQLFDEYAAYRNPEEPIGLQRGRWLYRTGRAQEAFEQLEQLTTGADVPAAVASSASALLAIWSMEDGDSASAVRFASQVTRSGEGGATFPWSPMIALLTESELEPEELAARIDAAFPDPRQAALRENALGQLLFFHGHYAEAIPVLRARYEASAPFTEDEVGWQLGYALTQTGDEEEAEELLATFPVTQPSNESLFYEVAIRRVASWRENR